MFISCSSFKSRMIGVSTPLIGFALVPIVSAGSKKVHPRELDIYWEPQDVAREFVEAEPSVLEQKVSYSRKFVWEFASNIEDKIKKVKQFYETTENKTAEFGKLIQTDRTLQVKVGVITTGVLLGAVLAGRGRRPYKRFFYSAGLGTVAAAVCYPKCALSITQSSYKRFKSFVQEQHKKYSESKPSKEPSQQLIEEADVTSPLQTSNDANINENVVTYPDNAPEEPVVEQEQFTSVRNDTNVEQPFWKKIPFLINVFEDRQSKKEETSKLVDKENIQQTKQVELVKEKKKSPQDVFGDHGQSNPDDKDMYTTRT